MKQLQKTSICVLFLFCAIAFAQKPSVAIFVNSDGKAEPSKGAYKMLGSQLTKAIIKSGEYKAVDRSDDALKALKKEHGYQRGGAVSDEQIKKLGAQFGAQFMCVIEISETGSDFFLEAKLVDIESSEISALGNANSRLASSKKVIEAADEIADQLFENETGRKPSKKKSASGGSDPVYLQVKESIFGGASEHLTLAMQNLIQDKGLSLSENPKEGVWQIKLDAKECNYKESVGEHYCQSCVKIDLYNNDEGASVFKGSVAGQKVGWTSKETACQKAFEKAADAVWEKVQGKIGELK